MKKGGAPSFLAIRTKLFGEDNEALYVIPRKSARVTAHLKDGLNKWDVGFIIVAHEVVVCVEYVSIDGAPLGADEKHIMVCQHSTRSAIGVVYKVSCMLTEALNEYVQIHSVQER